MASMTKREFARIVREIQSEPLGSRDVEIHLYLLADDLGYIEHLARSIPEEKLKELESQDEERFW